MKRGILHFLALMLLFAAGAAARAQTNTNSNTNTSAAASPAAQRMNQKTFQIIENRNIFDPNRRPARVVRDTGSRDVIEYFGLNGAMTYENQAYAFFEGSGQVRNRAFKPADKINGYTIAAITNNTVKLQGGSNQVVNMTVGMQLRRVNNGPWSVVASSVPPPDSGSSGSAGDSSGGSAPTLSGPDADVMARLMKRRAEETKDPSTGSTGEGTGTNEIH